MALEVRHVTVDDPLLAPLFAELAFEYGSRYGQRSHDELTRYPAKEFAAPHGAFLALVSEGRAVAGGAFRRRDAETAELKRIWTSSAHRRRGLARRIVHELENAATDLGYTRIYLTTGPRQPEAKALYLAAGYTPRFDLTVDPETIGPLPFDKALAPRLPETG
jgi:GNAT superfamily N-acetyltransferase